MTRPARPTRRKSSTPEGAVLAASLQLLRLRGVMSWRQNNVAVSDGGRFRAFAGLRGVSDVIGVFGGGSCDRYRHPPIGRPGRALFVECKAPKGRLSDHQRAFLEAARASGAVAIVVRDVAELAVILDRLEREPDAVFPIE